MSITSKFATIDLSKTTSSTEERKYEYETPGNYEVKKEKVKIEIEIESDDEDSSSEDDNENDNDVKEEFEEPNELGIRLLKGFAIYNYQLEAIKWMKERENNPRLNVNGAILSLEMGLGKTISTTALCMSDNMKTYPEIPGGIKERRYPNLVVCSKTVAYEWKRDIKKFYGSSCPFLYLHKSELDNFDLITYDSIKDFKIIITTYETIMNTAKKNKLADKQFVLDQFGRKAGIEGSRTPSINQMNMAKGGMVLFKTPWNRIILDESHRIANPKSATFYAAMCLYGTNKWCLSGTPLRNYSHDIYSQLRFCGYDQVILPKQFNYDIYNRQKLYEFILYKDYKDVGVTLPGINEKNVIITLEEKEKEIYDYYHGATKRVYNGFLVGSYDFSNVLTLFLRLRQICISPYTILAESSRNYKGKEEKDYTVSQQILDNMTDGLATWVKDKMGTSGIESAKTKKIIDTIACINPGEKTLVFTYFKKYIDILSLALKTKLPSKKFLILDGDVVGKDRDRTLDQFKNPKLEYDVMFISYKVGSEGLNLVEANNIIMCENWWTPVVDKQAMARSYRIGQKNIVNVWRYIINNSIEERIDAVCKEKLQKIDDFLISKKKFSTKLDAATLGRIIK